MVVRPVALYRAECGPVTVKHEQILHSMEMQMLRSALRQMCLDHFMNMVVQKMIRVALLTEMMCETHLCWYIKTVKIQRPRQLFISISGAMTMQQVKEMMDGQSD